MKKSRHTEEQIAFALKQAETGTPVAEVIRRMGVSEQTFYRWKKVYGGLGVGELRRVKQLEDENRKLKQLVADLSLDKHILQDVLAKKLWRLGDGARSSRTSRRPTASASGAVASRSVSTAHRCATCRTSRTKRRCGCASTIWRQHGCAMAISESTSCYAGRAG